MREAIRSELTEAAVRLMREVGFAGTTAGEIAAAVGVSERTFFRYFPTKEDAVLQPIESLGSEIAAALKARPAAESPLHALRAALNLAVESVVTTPDRWATLMTLGRSEPALRRRHLQQQDVWVEGLATVLDDRLGLPAGSPVTRLQSGVMMLAWERALVGCYERQDFSRIGVELDGALEDLRHFVA
jgi:AcrR family transcriptional regulator